MSPSSHLNHRTCWFATKASKIEYCSNLSWKSATHKTNETSHFILNHLFYSFILHSMKCRRIYNWMNQHLSMPDCGKLSIGMCCASVYCNRTDWPPGHSPSLNFTKSIENYKIIRKFQIHSLLANEHNSILTFFLFTIVFLHHTNAAKWFFQFVVVCTSGTSTHRFVIQWTFFIAFRYCWARSGLNWADNQHNLLRFENLKTKKKCRTKSLIQFNIECELN